MKDDKGKTFKEYNSFPFKFIGSKPTADPSYRQMMAYNVNAGVSEIYDVFSYWNDRVRPGDHLFVIFSLAGGYWSVKTRHYSSRAQYAEDKGNKTPKIGDPKDSGNRVMYIGRVMQVLDPVKNNGRPVPHDQNDAIPTKENEILNRRRLIVNHAHDLW